MCVYIHENNKSSAEQIQKDPNEKLNYRKFSAKNACVLTATHTHKYISIHIHTLLHTQIYIIYMQITMVR